MFGRSNRFNKNVSFSPGPVYELPSSIRTKKVDKKLQEIAKSNQDLARGRVSWVAGTMRGSVAMQSLDNTGEKLGPADYRPSRKRAASGAPKHSFPQGQRYLSQTVRFMGHGHVRENIGLYAPGPKYLLNEEHDRRTKRKAPTAHFGSGKTLERWKAGKSLGDDVETDERGSFLTGVMRGDVVFPNKDQKGRRIGPGTYEAKLMRRTSQPVVGSAPRFRTGSLMISRGALREQQCESSPGPIYWPKDRTMGEEARRASTATTVRNPLHGKRASPPRNTNQRSSWVDAHLQAGNVDPCHRVVSHETRNIGPGHYELSLPSTFETHTFNRYARESVTANQATFQLDFPTSPRQRRRTSSINSRAPPLSERAQHEPRTSTHRRRSSAETAR
eukprot:343579_1